MKDADQQVMITQLATTYLTLVYCSNNNRYVGSKFVIIVCIYQSYGGITQKIFLAQAEILTRSSRPSPKTIAKAEKSLKKYNIDMSQMMNFDQKKCYTEPQLESYSNSYLESFKQSQNDQWKYGLRIK